MNSQPTSIVYYQIAQTRKQECFNWKFYMDEISPLKKIIKALFLKFEHLDFTIGGDSHFDFVGGHSLVS